MQRSFLSPAGVIARLRGPVPETEQLLQCTSDLIIRARSAGIPIIYTRHVYRSDYADADLLMRSDERAQKAGALISGSTDADIMPEFAPINEVVIDKNRYDAFRGTILDEELRRHGIRELLIAGVLTNVCVEANIRAAYDRDYPVVVLEDCSAARTQTLHHNSIAGLVQSRLARAMKWGEALQDAD
jgi:nicotinamidase-related amidase